MFSLESTFSYVFFISILITLSTASVHHAPDGALNNYRLLEDAAIVLGKLGYLDESSLLLFPIGLKTELDNIRSETGFCVSLSFHNFEISSVCAASRAEAYSQEIFISGLIAPQKATLSIWCDTG